MSKSPDGHMPGAAIRRNAEQLSLDCSAEVHLGWAGPNRAGAAITLLRRDSSGPRPCG